MFIRQLKRGGTHFIRMVRAQEPGAPSAWRQEVIQRLPVGWGEAEVQWDKLTALEVQQVRDVLAEKDRQARARLEQRCSASLVEGIDAATGWLTRYNADPVGTRDYFGNDGEHLARRLAVELPAALKQLTQQLARSRKTVQRRHEAQLKELQARAEAQQALTPSPSAS